MPGFELNGRVAIVTGASQGLGKSIALTLANFGADVVVVARKPEPVTGGQQRPHAPVGPVVEEIQRIGRRALGITADVREPDDVTTMIRKTLDAFGRIDILVNNAGGSWGESFRRGSLLETTYKDLEETFRLNVKSVYLCSSAVAPIMKKQGKGVIINIASMGGRIPTPGIGAYSAAKAAVISLTQTMAQEWAPEIRVNALAPGSIATPHRPRGAGSPESEERREALKRAGDPEEYAGAVLYLVSDYGGFATGSIFEIHGGRRA